MQTELKQQIKKAKTEYKEKVETQLRSGSMYDAWKGLKTMAGQNKAQICDTSLDLAEQTDFAEKLNDFYCRFDKHDFKTELTDVLDEVRTLSPGVVADPAADEITTECVEKVLSKVKVRKAAGPDNLSGRVLRVCCSQLAPVFAKIFNLSVLLHTIPSLWKQHHMSCPQKAQPYRTE